MTLPLLLIILALICLFAAAFNVSAPRVNLTALGLALWCLSTVLRV